MADFVYFVHAPAVKMIKIGYSNRPGARLSALRVGSPVPLELLGTIRDNTNGARIIEEEIHAKFWKLHSHGEWFRESEELLNFIKDRILPEPRRKMTRWKPKKERHHVAEPLLP